MQLSNYLFFTNTCEAALTYYARCNLGAVTDMIRHGDKGMPLHNEAMRGKIMHAKFVGPGIAFFASDNHDAEPMRGFAQMLELEDKGETERLFGRLADGGTITTPLGVHPWSNCYGKLTDRFGVQWMFNCPA